MGLEAGSTTSLFLAHVLFIDLVGYSKLPMDQQRKTLQKLQKAVSDTPEFTRATAADHLICLPTGDGMALAFFGDPEAPVRCAVQLWDALRTLPEIQLRMGIHTGPVYRVEDINTNKNLAGGGINLAQRVMDCGDAGHILISDTVAEVLRQISKWSGTLHDLGETEVKHGHRVRLFNLHTSDIGNPAVPQKLASAKPLTNTRRKWLVLALLGLFAATGIGWTGTVLYQRMSRPGLTQPIVVAVLPFRSLSPIPERSLIVGLPDAIITQLATLKRMRVRPTSAVLPYEDQKLEPDEVGRRLKADYVVTGAIQSTNDRVRVTVQLVSVNDGSTVWAEQYDTVQRGLLSLQDDITRSIVNRLKISIAGVERERFYRRYTENGAAYQLYLRGRSDLVRHTEDAIRAAIESFEEALRLDPNYALAHAGLAQAFAEMPSRYAVKSEVKTAGERAEAEAKRALELDPDLAEAHQALAAVFRKAEYNWEGTFAESRKALELNPSLDQPHYYLGGAFYHLGLLDLVEPEVRAGLELNPEDRVEAFRERGVAALLDGRYRDAVPWLEQVQQLSPKHQSDLWLARNYYYLGEVSRAEEMLRELGGSSSASTSTRAKADLASFLAAHNEAAKAERLLRDVLAGSYMDHHVAYSMGAAYSQLRRREDALHWLRQAAQTGFPCYPWYTKDPLLQPLHTSPEFIEFIDRMKTSWEEARQRYGSNRQ